jgi:hypothetical protein
MHPAMLKEVIAVCRQRSDEGDCPTVDPFTVEQLEGAVIALAYEADNMRASTLTVLAEAMRKFAPDLAEELRQRWNCASGKDLIDLLNAFKP